MTFSPRCWREPGDLRLKSVGLDGRQIEGFAEELARRPGVVIRQHPPSQFLGSIRPLLYFPPLRDTTAHQSPRSNGLPSISFHCFFWASVKIASALAW